jgi:hypothetical protein
MVREDKDSCNKQTSEQIISISGCRDTQVVVTGDKPPLSSIDEEDSIIEFFLDTFNFKRVLKKIVNNQSYFKITNNFINLILMLLFLAFIFWQDDVLTLEKKSTTITLMVLVIGAFLEFFGANTSVFKGFLNNEIKTKRFIDRLPFLSYREIKQGIRDQTFSPACFNYFIEGLRDINKYPPSVVYLVLDSHYLWKQNLDLLFSPEIIKNISTKLILRILFKKRNCLTQDNILNIYNSYSNNRDIVKTLIATQEYSEFLIKLYPEDSELSEYFQKYQKEKEHLDWILKIISIRRLYLIKKISRSLTFLFTVNFVTMITMASVQLMNTPISLWSELDYILYWSIVSTILLFILPWVLDYIMEGYNYHYKHMINNIIKK